MSQQIDIERLQQEWATRYGSLVVELAIAKSMIAEMAVKLEAAATPAAVDAYQE